MLDSILIALQKVWLKIRIKLSNRYVNLHKDVLDIVVDDKCKNITEVRAFCKKLYENFTWTQDSATYLFDYMRSPAQCYRDFIVNGHLYDDCDGFHAAVYQAVKDNFECYLITCMTLPLDQSHTMLIFKYRNSWYLVDYKTVKIAGNNIEQVVSEIQSLRNIKVNCYNLAYFDTEEYIWKIKENV